MDSRIYILVFSFNACLLIYHKHNEVSLMIICIRYVITFRYKIWFTLKLLWENPDDFLFFLGSLLILLKFYIIETNANGVFSHRRTGFQESMKHSLIYCKKAMWNSLPRNKPERNNSCQRAWSILFVTKVFLCSSDIFTR